MAGWQNGSEIKGDSGKTMSFFLYLKPSYSYILLDKKGREERNKDVILFRWNKNLFLPSF